MISNKNTFNRLKETKSSESKRLKQFTFTNKNISVGKSIVSVLDGSFLTRNNLMVQIPFILFITLLGIMYIANSYNAEKTIIDISRGKRDLEELRYDYITTRANVMFQSKQSEIAYRLASRQIKESIVPPIKLKDILLENE